MAHWHDWQRVQYIADEPRYCSAPQRPEDIIWEGSDIEDSPSKTYEKRLRYQKAADRYLRGEIPVLQSASLRGPFGQETGWINPWRYKPRNRPDWWQPESGDLLFTRADVLKWAKDCGLGHLAPGEALARCKAEAKAEAAAMQGWSSLMGGIGSIAAQKGSDVMKEADLDREGNDSEDDSDIMEVSTDDRASSKCPDNSAFQSELHRQPNYSVGGTERSSTENFSGLPGNATRGTKRAVDSQWLKSNISKRSRLGSPAPVSTPTPIFNAQVEKGRMRRRPPSRAGTLHERTASDQDPRIGALPRTSRASGSKAHCVEANAMDDARPTSRRVSNRAGLQEPTAGVVTSQISTRTSLSKTRKRVPGLEAAQAIWESLQPKSHRQIRELDVSSSGGFYLRSKINASALSREDDSKMHVMFEDRVASKDTSTDSFRSPKAKLADGRSKIMPPRRRSSSSEALTNLQSRQRQSRFNRRPLQKLSEDIDELHDDSQESSFASTSDLPRGARKLLKILSKPDSSNPDLEPGDLTPNSLHPDPVHQTPAVHDSQNSFVTEVAPSTRGLATFQFRKKRKTKAAKSNNPGHVSSDKTNPILGAASLKTSLSQIADDDNGQVDQEAPQLLLDYIHFDRPQTEEIGSVGAFEDPTPCPPARETPIESFNPEISSPSRFTLGDRTTEFRTPRVHTPKIPTPEVLTPFGFEISFEEGMFLGAIKQVSSIARPHGVLVPKAPTLRTSPRAGSSDASISKETRKAPTLQALTLKKSTLMESSSRSQIQQDPILKIPTSKTSSLETPSRSGESDSSWDMVEDVTQPPATTPQTTGRDPRRTPRSTSQGDEDQEASQVSRPASTPVKQIGSSQMPSTLDPSQRRSITVYASGKLHVPPERSQRSPTKSQLSPMKSRKSPEKSQTLPKLQVRIHDLREADPLGFNTQSYDSAFATSPLKRSPFLKNPHHEAPHGQTITDAGNMEDIEDVENNPPPNTQRSISDIEHAVDQSPFLPKASKEYHVTSNFDETDDLDVVRNNVSQNEQSAVSETILQAEQSPFQRSSRLQKGNASEDVSMEVASKRLESPQAAIETTPIVQEPQSPWVMGDVDHIPVVLPTKALVESFVVDELDKELSASDEVGPPEHDISGLEFDWQRNDRPTTPDDEDDEIRPFRDFMTPSPDPEDADREELGIPSTQLLYDEANNPWKSSLRNPASGKSKKRVSFGILPLDVREDYQLEMSLPKPRPCSPPPTVEQFQDEDLVEEDDDTTEANTLANKSKVAIPKYKPILSGRKYNLNESPFKRSSPPLEAMAEAFIAADRGTSLEPDRKPAPFEGFTRHLKPMNEARTNFASQESVEDTGPMDSFSITPAGKVKKMTRYDEDFNLDGIMVDLGGWSVEAELKQANTEANGGKCGGKKTPKRRERGLLSEFGNVWS